MTLVGGFPFVMPEMHNMSIYMPYWDAPLKKVQWKGFNDVFWVNPQTGINGFSGCIAKWAWLNKCNPDWMWVAPDLPDTLIDRTGYFAINCPDVSGALIQITSGAELVDRWWGSQEIGKYGVCAFGTSQLPIMPFTFINTQKCFVESTKLNNDTLFCNFPQGVVADITLRSKSGGGVNPYIIPPVYYTCEYIFPWAGTGVDEPTPMHPLNYIP